MSENSTVEYGSSVSSVERFGMVNRRSESLSSVAQLWKGSETDTEGTKLDDGKGLLAFSEFPASQFPQPFASASPNRECSDSQNSSSESRSASGDWPRRDCGTLKALYHRERTITGGRAGRAHSSAWHWKSAVARSANPASRIQQGDRDSSEMLSIPAC